ncbi:MAG: FAD-binding oxidoreductase [Rhodobacteraceae bacterium TMED160]|nr:MAG: FAD-binding oxidoreductase [Rhodobacteraceae bacterium TMED160]
MSIIEELKKVLGDQNVLTGTDKDRYSSDWLGQYSFEPLCVVRPASTQEVSKVVRLASAAQVNIVPVGGNTGLNGGTHSDNAISISMERMNSIHEIRVNSKIAIVDAGVILANLHNVVNENDLMFPLTFGARGSATIGGVLSTNAGGSNVLKYGNTRDLVLGVEIVLPNGEIMNLMSELHKDNSGYCLRDLVIGAEGTLGIITQAVLKLFPRPKAYATAMVAVNSLDTALSLLNELQDGTGGAVAAYEYMPKRYIQGHMELSSASRRPFKEDYEHLVMVELETTVELFSRCGDDGQVLLSGELERILDRNLDKGLILDAHIAQNEEQRLIMWERREAAAEISLLKTPLINNDIAVPLDKISKFLTIMEKKLPELDPDADVLIVSHLGDGNVHYTVWPSRDDEQHKDKIMEAIENVVLSLGGSFSAEHGIGLSKLSSMERRKDRVALDVMRQIKHAIDPEGIMNPGKVLPKIY